MLKKLIGLLVIGFMLFFTFSCPPPDSGCISSTMEEYGYSMYFGCLLLAGFGQPGSTIVDVGDVSTITFTNMVYTGTSTVSGSVVYNDGVFPATEVGNLTFTDDPQGLTTIQTNMEYDGSDYTGTFTINGCNDPSGAAYQQYIESLL